VYTIRGVHPLILSVSVLDCSIIISSTMITRLLDSYIRKVISLQPNRSFWIYERALGKKKRKEKKRKE
jgi:hypothetical protein